MAEEKPKKLESTKTGKVAGGKVEGCNCCPWCHEWFANDDYFAEHVNTCRHKPTPEETK